MRRKIVLFDLDDTLYKEIDFLHSAYRCIAQRMESEYGLNGIYSFMLEAYENKKDVFSSLIETYGLPISKTDLLTIYRTHLPDIHLDPETWKVLNILSQQSVLGVITDGRSITQRNKFKALGLSEFIADDNLIISEEFGSEKPSRNNYLYFQDKYGDADFTYVGDNVYKDFIVPNSLGWNTICLLNDGRNIHQQDFSLPKEYLPLKKIHTLTELLCLWI